MSKSKVNADKLKSLQTESKAAKDSEDLQDSLYRRHLRTAVAGTDSRADELVKQANKTLRKLFGGESKYDTAAELLEQAGKAYKMNDNFMESGETFVRLAEIQETKLKNSVEACAAYAAGAKAFREVDIDRCLETFKLCVALHMENGRHESAARIYVEIAEIEEIEGRPDGAIESYQNAIDCFESGDMHANAVQCYSKMAALLIDGQQWLKAGDAYEKCALISIDKSINRGTIHEWFYLAMLAYFVHSATVEFSIALPESKFTEYIKLNRRHETTREFQVMNKCFDAFEDEDVKGFTKAIFEFDKLKNISERESDCWLRIKQALKMGPQAPAVDGEENEDYT